MSVLDASARMPEAVLSDEMIEDMRAKVGLELRIEHSVNNEEATRLAILKFVDGIGDPNPLWRDREHAASSPYCNTVAPPTWPICCFAGLQFGWPGLGSFHSESDLTFYRPVFQGDRIRASCTYEGFDGPSRSAFAGRKVVDHFLNRYTNQHDDVVAEIRWNVINVERQAARSRTSSRQMAPELPHPWDISDVEMIEAEILDERPRGPEVRYWEDVNVGDQIDEIIKGPITTTDEVAFVAAGGAPIPRLAAHGVALRMYERHKAWAFRDPETSALEPIYAVHYNKHAAQAMGVAMQYDVGFQRQCWQGHLLTWWMGDHAWLKHASAQYRSFVYLSDVIRLGGLVTAKHIDEEGDPIVEIRTHAINQRGDDVMPGTAAVALASRTRGNVPAEAAVARHHRDGR